MPRNPENREIYLKILLKDIDKLKESLDIATKQRCIDLLKTLSYTREEIVEQVFGRVEKKDLPRYKRLLTLLAKEAGLDSLALEKKRKFGERSRLHYQRLVEEHGEAYARQRQLTNAHKGVEADGRVVYSDEEKAFIMEQKQLLGTDSGANKKIAQLCNERFHGGKEVRTAEGIGKQYYKRKKKGESN